ncbi:MAG: NAD(P)H-binding protein, partial [Gloeobacteraceae cyanobacterium ES-bin-316]|nr:NAD(P)H-binding protein [Ferruginibacter sp.]
MNILITGANGYIGQRLIPVLLQEEHQLFCLVRNRNRFDEEHSSPLIVAIEGDFLKPDKLPAPPEEIDVAYYLMHSMSGAADFEDMEAETAKNFLTFIQKTKCRQIVFLTGIVNEQHLSRHLASRMKVEQILSEGTVPLTALRAGIIVGSGSASFEIIRDIVEKLPVMVAPKWLNTLCQPIAIRNVIQFLSSVALKEQCYNKNFDIGGPEVLSYKAMLQQFAKVRKLKRSIFIVPVMTPKLSSYWLYFITST